jgi:hypothetical protein
VSERERERVCVCVCGGGVVLVCACMQMQFTISSCLSYILKIHHCYRQNISAV